MLMVLPASPVPVSSGRTSLVVSPSPMLPITGATSSLMLSKVGAAEAALSMVTSFVDGAV